MKWKQLREGETNHELIWLAVSGASFVVAGTWLKSRLPLPQCLFHQLTGEPCPTCGATRCLRDLLGRHFKEAFLWNPVVFCALVGIILFDFYALAVLLLRLPRARPSPVSRGAANRLRAVAITVVAANWVYLIVAGR